MNKAATPLNKLKFLVIRLKKIAKITYKLNLFGPKFFLLDHKAILCNLKRSLFNKKTFINYPSQVNIAVCNDCNLKCTYCFEHSPFKIKDEALAENSYLSAKMDSSVFKKFIDDLADLGDNYAIGFPGRIGEPFLHSDFIKMCEYLKAKLPKSRVVITTNGTLIDEEQVKSLVDLGIDRLNISIVAGSSKVYHELTGAPPETFEKVINTINAINSHKIKKGKLKPRVYITSVICSLNDTEVMDMLKIGLELGVDAVGFHRMYFCAKKKLQDEKLLLSDKQVESLKGLLLEGAVFAQKNKLETNIPFFLGLLSKEAPEKVMAYRRNPWHISNRVFVLADGAVYAGQYEEELGNINKESFLRIWYSDKYKLLRSNAVKVIGDNKLFPCNFSCRCCREPLYKNPINGIR